MRIISGCFDVSDQDWLCQASYSSCCDAVTWDASVSDCCEAGWLAIAVTWDVFGSRLRMILAVEYQHLCLKSVSRRQINLGRNLSQSVTVMRVTSLPSAVFSCSLVASAIYGGVRSPDSTLHSQHYSASYGHPCTDWFI